MSMRFNAMAGALPPENWPITAVCVVADPNACPFGYEVLLRTQHDKGYEADLWSDSLFSKKIKRYLCVSRQHPIQQGKVILNSVLTDIALLNERDLISVGYTGLDTTQDSGEKALPKRRLAVRMEPRTSVSRAISKIVFTKQKRAPEGFTLIGELNNLSVCYQLGDVPQEATPAVPARPDPPLPYTIGSSGPARPPPPTTNYAQATYENTTPSYPNPANRASLNRMSSMGGSKKNPISGIDFQLNARLVSNTCSQAMPDLQLKSRAQIEAEYTYDFTLERSTLGLTSAR